MAKKNENKRCPLQKECGRKCEHVGAELKCDYYRNNGIGDNTIPDQEALRKQIEVLKERQDFENEIAALPDEEKEDSTANKLVYIPIGELHSHPDNPRKDLGDLTELAESIKAKGVMQNLTVVPREEGGYTVIIGHRRTGASKLAGLTELPCVIVEMSPREQIATMLLENMQRSDLTAYEQAQGFQMMIDFGDTVEGIAAKTGFSKKTVRSRLKMTELDSDIFKQVSAERQLSIGELEKIAQIEDLAARNELLKVCGTNNFEQAFNRALKQQKINCAMPFAKEAVKALKARKIERSETYGGKYTKILEVKLEDLKENEIPHLTKKHEKEKLFYNIDEYWGNLNLYVLTPKAAPIKRSKSEIEREKLIKDAHARLDALSAEAYELRYAFVKSLHVTKANTEAMMKGAMMALICEQHYYSSHINKREIYEEIGGIPKFEDYYTDKIFAKVVDAFRNDDKRLMPSVIYASFSDGAGEKFHSSYKSEYPKFVKNNRIICLYEWLISCGYQPSDDEQQLMDGTHPLFIDKDKPAEEVDETVDDVVDDAVDEDDTDKDLDADTTDKIMNQLREMYGNEEEPEEN